ncbi:acyl-CoA dehydrogenase family protein [Arenicella xantha]|uniref:L-prolyl-[peptidyl carrier protein] dehydrogenase n=1 Tax=Arenicella xantha TaxID=644221 RepID=A0A395JTQ0_9GAMM|nr:acyl-CoA dehydrogenase family protein [Arenicella xantha]RBP52968.1 L-prolyl-[peptidyl carrier protein] dehydrogenase [Arenicella xantha]
MDFSLTEQQEKIKGETLDFARAHFNNDLIERDKNQKFDRDLWRTAGKHKLMGLCIPEQYGGRGLDPLTTVVALEAFGEGCEDGGFCFAIAAHLFATVVPIWIFGSDEQRQHYLPNLCDGTWVAANAMTELTSGSDVFNLATAAVDISAGDETREFELNGHKTYVSNAPHADILLTYASTDYSKGFFGGISSFILNKSEHNFKVSEPIDKMGARTCQMGEVVFENLIVSHSALLGNVGGGGTVFNRSMEWERVCLGATHLGVMNRMLAKAVSFTKRRMSSGVPIGQNQAISHALSDLRTRLEAARLLTYQSAWKLGKSKRGMALDASMTKLSVSELFKDFSLIICQIYAGEGYVNNHEAERVMRDALGSTIYSGTSEVQKNIISKLI